jgi:nucleotide-sensitive chloride channel 1A
MSTTGHGFQIEYPAITLHAISRAESGPSIYCQLDEHAGDPNAVIGDDADVSDMRELSIVPQRISSRKSPVFFIWISHFLFCFQSGTNIRSIIPLRLTTP